MSLRDLTRQTVTTLPKTGTDRDNRPTYGAPSQRLARVRVEAVERESPEGTELVEVMTLHMDGEVALERGDQVTVDASGAVSHVVSVYHVADGQGRTHHTKVVAE